MNREHLRLILSGIASGELDIEAAEQQLLHLDFENIEFAQIDHQRSLRKGFPEIIFGQGKTPDQIIGILQRMNLSENIILVTRLEKEKADALNIDICFYNN